MFKVQIAVNCQNSNNVFIVNFEHIQNINLVLLLLTLNLYMPTE